MLNLSPTNLEENGDTPEVIVESASEDDEIDISQFVESVLEEEPSETIDVCPQLVFTTPAPSASQQHFIDGRKVIGTLTPVKLSAAPIRDVSGIYRNPGNNVQRGPGPASRVGPRIIRRNFGPPTPSFTWLRDCFSKMKNSSLTLNHQVKCLEDRFKSINANTDAKKVMSLASDLQTLLKQTELGYKYLGTELAAAQRAYLQNLTQMRGYANRNNSNILVRRQVLLPVSSERKVISNTNVPVNTGISLPPNMIISMNGNNHSLSITVENDTVDVSALCAKFNIKPCYVLLERCDEPNESDNDDIQIIQELIAL